MTAIARRRRAARVVSSQVELGRAVLGVWNLVDARRRGPSGTPDGLLTGVSRILGVRQVVQAFLVGRTGTPEAHTLGALVDATHAATMVPFAFLPGRRGSFARTQLVLAVVLTCVEIGLVGRPGRP